MIRRFVHSAVLSLCFAAAFCAGARAEGSGDFARLTLHIAPLSKNPLPVEPVPVTITLSNNTGKPVRGHACIAPNTGFMKLHVAAPKGPFEEFMAGGWPVAGIEEPAEHALKPGRIDSVDAYLYYDAGKGRYVFPASGNYRIKATLRALDGKTQIESNIITVQVKDPVKEDAAAYQFLKELEHKPVEGASYAGFLMLTFGRNPTAPDRKVLHKQEDFLSKFPESRYARYVAFSLGRSYCAPGSNKLARGMLSLERAGDYEDFFLAPKALSVLVETCVKQRYFQKARRHLATLKAKFPNSKEYKYAAYVVGRAGA